VLGEDHPETAISLDSMGMLCQAQGNADEAQRYFERALAIRRAAFGDHHPDVAISLAALGALSRDQRDDDRARQCFDQALAICEPRLGHDHPATRAIRSDRARIDSWSRRAIRQLSKWSGKLRLHSQ
jgi:tetratricopeptide (TPR) repeat protein